MDSINRAGHILDLNDPLLKRLADLEKSIIPKKRGGAAGSNGIL